jgi:hypothetical protein
MRRIPIYFSDDILMEEVISMAAAHGFHVRHANGMTVVDRVPNFLKSKTATPNVVQLKKGMKK